MLNRRAALVTSLFALFTTAGCGTPATSLNVAAPPPDAGNASGYAIPLLGSVGVEHKARTGADAFGFCAAAAGQGLASAVGDAKLYGGFWTDQLGEALWSAELEGGSAVIKDPSAFASVRPVALCWFQGKPNPMSPSAQYLATGDSLTQAVDVATSFILRVDGDSKTGSVIAASPQPIAVFAPSPPRQSTLDAKQVRYPQPAGVETLPARPILDQSQPPGLLSKVPPIPAPATPAPN